MLAQKLMNYFHLFHINSYFRKKVSANIFVISLKLSTISQYFVIPPVSFHIPMRNVQISTLNVFDFLIKCIMTAFFVFADFPLFIWKFFSRKNGRSSTQSFSPGSTDRNTTTKVHRTSKLYLSFWVSGTFCIQKVHESVFPMYHFSNVLDIHAFQNSVKKLLLRNVILKKTVCLLSFVSLFNIWRNGWIKFL